MGRGSGIGATERRQGVLEALKRLEKAGKTPAHYEEVYGKMKKGIQGKCKATDVQRDLNEMQNNKDLAFLGDDGTVKKERAGAYSYHLPEPEKPKPVLAAYGIDWERDKVDWEGRRSKTKPKLIGKDPQTGKEVDFDKQVGIYMLRQGAVTVYVGRVKRSTNDQNGLYDRMRYHNKQKPSWGKFSWFGFLDVGTDGNLSEDDYIPPVDQNVFKELSVLQLVTIIEAVMIEGIGFRDNSRGGDLGSTPRFDQVPSKNEVGPGSS